MKRTLLLLAAVGILFYSCKTEEKKPTEERAPLVALADFFKDPEKAGYRISPNGENIIFRAPYKGRMNVFVQKLGDTTAIPITQETERNPYDAYWESDDRIIFIKDVGGDENTHILS